MFTFHTGDVPSTCLLSCTGLKARPMGFEVDAEGKGTGREWQGKVRKRRSEGKEMKRFLDLR